MGNLGLQLVVLSVCDVVATLSLPSTILDLLLGQWILGNGLCKAHWAAESLGRLPPGCFDMIQRRKFVIEVAGSTGVLSLAIEASFCVRGCRRSSSGLYFAKLTTTETSRFRWSRLVLTNVVGLLISVLFVLPNLYYAAETPEPPQFIPDPYPDGRDKVPLSSRAPPHRRQWSGVEAELMGPKVFLGTTTAAPRPRLGRRW